MSFMDKLRNKLQMGVGRAKEQTGRAADDPRLETEGRSDRVTGSIKQVGEQVKEAAKNIKNASTKPTK